MERDAGKEGRCLREGDWGWRPKGHVGPPEPPALQEEGQRNVPPGGDREPEGDVSAGSVV